MKKVLFIDEVHPVLREELTKNRFECIDGTKLTRKEVLAEIGKYEGVVLRSRLKLDDEFFDAAIQLKFAARSGSGLENIDLEKAERCGVAVFNSPEGNCTAVAEHAVGMLLALLNKLIFADAQVRRGIWLREENRGQELESKTVGIIGYGHTGSAFARRLSGFGCEVIAHDKYKTGFGSDTVGEVTLEELQKRADVVSFHVPLTDETKYFLDESFIAKTANPFILINTSRGPVVKTSALVRGLKSGKVTGACLDVLEYEKFNFEKTEKLPADFEYLAVSENVVLSPHTAGWTEQSYKKLSLFLAGKILKFYGINRTP